MSEWQPIETAPLDGTDILVWGPHGHGCLVVGFDDEPEHPGFPWITLDGRQYPPAAFSHWMPLPATPDKEGAEE
jgi:hypothetical protein